MGSMTEELLSVREHLRPSKFRSVLVVPSESDSLRNIELSLDLQLREARLKIVWISRQLPIFPLSLIHCPRRMG